MSEEDTSHGEFFRELSEKDRIFLEEIKNRIRTSDDIINLLPIATPDIIAELKKDQQIIEYLLVIQIDKGYNVEAYLNLATPETIQSALIKGLRARIKKGYGSEKYTKLATVETIEELRGDQEIIEIGLIIRIRNGLDVEVFLNFAKPETVQAALVDGLRTRIVNGHDITNYIHLATPETIIEISKKQELVKEGLTDRITKGFNITELLQIATEETKNKLFEDIDKLRWFVRIRIGHFFDQTHDLIHYTTEELASLSRDELWEILFDCTTMPVGIKFHVPNDTGLSKILDSTGGFVAHGAEQCFVANPVMNQQTLRHCFNILDRYLRDNDGALENIPYIQTCCGHKLPNGLAGVATISFLLTKPIQERFTMDVLKHEQGVRGITIPDAGTVSIGYPLPCVDGSIISPEIDSRTDMLFCRNLDEVKMANDILTLLAHASIPETDPPLAHRSIGIEFAKEVSELLVEFNLGESLDTVTFIKVTDSQLPDLHLLITHLTEIRDDFEDTTTKLNNAVSFVSSPDVTERERNQVRNQFEELANKYRESLPMRLHILVQKYREMLRPEGLQRLVLEDEWS